MNKKNTELENRLFLASQIASGLLSSQDPEKGWNLDTLTILSLKVADKLIDYAQKEELPELFPTQQRPNGEQA
jgi:hypothetical protein